MTLEDNNTRMIRNVDGDIVSSEILQKEKICQNIYKLRVVELIEGYNSFFMQTVYLNPL